MAGVLFKVRCPSCGKSLRIDGADASAQVICKACGTRVEVPAAPLLGPLVADASGIPILEAVSARPWASSPSASSPAAATATPPPPLASDAPTGAAPTVQVPTRPTGSSLQEAAPTTPPATWTFEPSDARRTPLGTVILTPTAGGFISELDPTAPMLPRTPLPEDPFGGIRLTNQGPSTIQPGTTSDVMVPDVLPPWAAASAVPDAPPPRLVPTRPEPADPDEEQVRLGYVQAPPLPVINRDAPHRSFAAATPVAPTTPAAPTSGGIGLDDTAIHPPIRDDDPDHSPSADDVRTILAAHRAGQLRLVSDRQRHGHPFWWTLLGMLSAAAIVLIALAATGQIDWFDPWEKQASPTIAQFKAEAEAFAVRGALKESHERYQKIEELIRGRPIRDPQLRQQVESAREAGKTVYALLLSRMAEAAPPAPAANPTPGPGATVPAPVPPAGNPNGAGPVASATPAGKPPVASVGADPRATPGSQPANGGDEPKPAASKPPATRPAVAAAPQGPPARRRPAPRPVADPNDGPITDAEIGRSIQAGVDHLLKQFDETTHVVRNRDRRNDAAYFAGLDALAVYALLQAGQAIDDPRISHRSMEMKAKVEALRNLPIEGSHQTYARGLRATALASINRAEDFKVMANDVDWLLGTTDGGAYTYNGDYKPVTRRGNFASENGSWDNSNSQYGLLGVWSGIEADPRIEVPTAYWKAVDRHWTECQSKDGQWGYGEGGTGGRLTMTCAGIASLFVAHEYLEPPLMGAQTGREPFSPALKKGLEWFERGNNSVNVRDGGNWWGYTIYGIERVGLASGFKHFGNHDWYRELSEQIVNRQLGNGSWGDGVVDTSYALLFLARGRHPILMNKLRYDGYWANRPRDVSNMSRYATRQFERPINWQVVNIDNDWTDWTDSPILYIASHEPPTFDDEQIEKLRRFVQSGG